MDTSFQGADQVQGSFRGDTGILVGRGGTGTDQAVPECEVCFAALGGDHGGFCPNNGIDPAGWVTGPPPGFERPLREAPSQHG